MKEDNGLKHLKFNLNDTNQKIAYDFFKLTGRKTSVFIADIVCAYLRMNHVTDVNSLTTSDAKNLLQYAAYRFREPSVSDFVQALVPISAHLSQTELTGSTVENNSQISPTLIVRTDELVTPSEKRSKLDLSALNLDAVKTVSPPVIVSIPATYNEEVEPDELLVEDEEDDSNTDSTSSVNMDLYSQMGMF